MASIPLTPELYKAIERMLQWPEDLPAYDRLNTPTQIPESELFPKEVTT